MNRRRIARHVGAVPRPLAPWVVPWVATWVATWVAADAATAPAPPPAPAQDCPHPLRPLSVVDRDERSMDERSMDERSTDKRSPLATEKQPASPSAPR